MSVEMMTLTATTREFGNKGAARRTRRAGRIPAVVYGKGAPGTAVSVDPKEVAATLQTELGFNVVFSLAAEGGETWKVMVKEYQFDGVRRELTHIDFVVVDDNDVVEIPVPVETVGKSEGVVMGGRLDVVRRAVKISCAVKDIPVAVVHDITAVQISESVYIDEMNAPEGCSFVFNNRFPVIRVARKRGAKVAEEGEEGAAADGEAAVEE